MTPDTLLTIVCVAFDVVVLGAVGGAWWVAIGLEDVAKIERGREE